MEFEIIIIEAISGKYWELAWIGTKGQSGESFLREYHE
jgi:hypothetical protein